jgi:hypothetical protein
VDPSGTSTETLTPFRFDVGVVRSGMPITLAKSMAYRDNPRR